jgi:ABC-type antimicrobial peptide transport system permease subunit
MFYVPLAQNVSYKDELMKRIELASHFVQGIMLVTDTPAGELQPLLTRTLAEVDSTLTIVSVRTMEQQVSLSFDRERSVTTLAGLFGVVALLLATVGLYGVTAYAVARRTAEIGIRMALGATRAVVVRMVLRGASSRVVVGLAVGVPLAIGAGHLISAELYGVSSWDPAALASAAGAMIVCAFTAALIPARRAASVSPTDALRTE